MCVCAYIYIYIYDTNRYIYSFVYLCICRFTYAPPEPADGPHGRPHAGGPEPCVLHPVSVRRFPSFRTQTLENLSRYLWTNGFLSNPDPGENLVMENLVMETGCTTLWNRESLTHVSRLRFRELSLDGGLGCTDLSPCCRLLASMLPDTWCRRSRRWCKQVGFKSPSIMCGHSHLDLILWCARVVSYRVARPTFLFQRVVVRMFLSCTIDLFAICIVYV